MFKKIIVLILMLLLVGCATQCSRQEAQKAPTRQNVPGVVIEEPKQNESELDSLKRQKREAEAYIKQLQAKVTGLDSQIKNVEIEQVKWWSKLVGSICLGLAGICLVTSFFIMSYPILPVILRYSSYILGSVGFMAFVYSALYGYFLLIGSIVAVVIVGVSVYMWFRDRNALRQVVHVVEDVKHEVVDYKTKFKQKIDKSSDKVIDRIRRK